MAKATVEVLVDDIDGSEGAETVRLGWNGDWRELELSKKNLASLDKALDKYWAAGRPVAGERPPVRRRRSKSANNVVTSDQARRNPRAIRSWANETGSPYHAWPHSERTSSGSTTTPRGARKRVVPRRQRRDPSGAPPRVDT